MVKIEEILERAVPIAIVVGTSIWLLSQILKPTPIKIELVGVG